MRDALDLLSFRDQLTPEHEALRARMQRYLQATVAPDIDAAWEAAEFRRELIAPMAGLGILGSRLRGHGCAGLDALGLGLVRYELARVDGSIGTFFGVQSGLAMGAIGRLGSDEQRARWLPAMARLERIGAFALSEPERGSDAANVLTRAHRATRAGVAGYTLHGAKRWIGNAPIADLWVVFARDDDGRLGGFVLEDPLRAPGASVETIRGKVSKRSVLNGAITLDGAFVPEDARLASLRGFADVAAVLTETRYTVCWEAAGIAAACFEHARERALRRVQFGRPIAAFQLTQKKLVDMAAEVAGMLGVCFQLARLVDAGRATVDAVALAKYSLAEKARLVAARAREVFGGDGILLENRVARLMLDAEALVTYEGTSEVNLLIAGRALTGHSAFGNEGP